MSTNRPSSLLKNRVSRNIVSVTEVALNKVKKYSNLKMQFIYSEKKSCLIQLIFI